MAFDNEGVNIVITGDSSKAVQEIRKVEASVNGLLSLEVGKSLEATFGTFFKTITNTLQSVARAVSGVMKTALSIGGGFEAQMTSVKVISGATTEELDALTKKAREMGATLPITAKDAATAMTLLAQRGYDAQKILASVNAVSNLSISQAVDMASAADILGSTITNFAMSVDDADRITAVFNNACNQSALSMSKLIEAMKYVGPAAGAVDMQLTEAVSAMEAIANAGLTGEMTGTGLAMVLSKLAAKSHILGVDTHDLNGSMRSIADIFSELKQKGFSLADAIAAFGQRGSKAALALAKNSASLKANEERLKQWDSTQNAVNEKMKTFTNTLNAFRSASEELHIEIFEQIKNQAKDAVGSIADLTRYFSKWVGETQIAGEALNAFLEGLGFNLPSVANLQSILQNFNVQGFLDNVKSFGNSLKGIADSIVGAFNMIKVPLGFLIEHLGAFATISFWGWISGKALQVPATILGIAASMKQLYSAGKMLLSLSWGALMNPIGATITAAGILTVVVGSKVIEARKAEQEFNDTIQHIQDEIKQADDNLKIHIDAGEFITGFEKLPASFFKASDELRQKTLDNIKALQAEFRDKYAKAVDYVADKFPDLTAQAVQSGIDIQNASKDTIQQITNALHGGEDEFKKLSPFLQAVVEQINLLDIYAGKGSEELLNMIQNFRKVQAEAEKMKPQNKVQTFFEDITANLRNVLANLPKYFDEANKFLNGEDIKLAVNVSLDKAKAQLNAFVKDTADKFAIPEDIVKQSTINRLKELADAGNKTAQILLHSWGDLDTSVQDFIDNAKEAITYLSASPKQFMPALNSMLNGIQKIDPVTGKLTDKFKKAHDTLKEWANVTFDKLTARIQKLRKAVEGGFIDSSALENEIERSLPQIRLQVISELEPMKNQFASQSDYLASLASDYVSTVQDLFGDAGTNFLRNIFNGKTGVEIGRSILRDIQQGGTSSQGYIKINGVEQSLNNAVSPLTNEIKLAADNFRGASQAITKTGDSILSLINSIHTPDAFNERADEKNRFALSMNSASSVNYSTQFANVLKELASFNSSAKENINAVNSVTEAIKDIQLQPFNENNLANAIINGFSPFLTAADNFSANLSNLTGVVEALRKSTEINSGAIHSLQSSMSSSSGELNISAAINPLVTAVQNLDVALTSIANSQQVNSNTLNDARNAISELQKAIVSISSGNTYNIDIHQQGFNVLNKSEADYAANSAVSAIRSGLGNGGI